MNELCPTSTCLAEYEMKGECTAQILPGSYNAFNIPTFKNNINMKRPDLSSVIQRRTFHIPQPIYYLQASFESDFAERQEDAEEESPCSHNILKRSGTNLLA